MTTYPAPICLGCTRFASGGGSLTCTAFPEGIPERIITSEVDHRQPVDGDHGQQFVPRAPRDAEYAQSLFEFLGSRRSRR